MFVQVGPYHINFSNVAYILIKENTDGSFSYRFVFNGEAILEYRSTNIEEITRIHYAIATHNNPIKGFHEENKSEQ